MYDSRNLTDMSVEENEDGDNCEGMDRSVNDLVNSKTINDILKYGAHQSCDSNPIETQSEWSDEDDRDDDEAKGKYCTDLTSHHACLSHVSMKIIQFQIQVELRVPATSPTTQA